MRRRRISVEHVEIDPCTPPRVQSSVIGVRTSRQVELHTSQHQASQRPPRLPAAHAHVAGMAADPTEDDNQAVTTGEAGNGTDTAQHVDDHGAEDDADEDDDEADEEPKLKYSRLTSSLGPVYRNGDATSSFLVAGDKMVWL
jgi:hypothetical protein